MVGILLSLIKCTNGRDERPCSIIGNPYSVPADRQGLPHKSPYHAHTGVVKEEEI